MRIFVRDIQQAVCQHFGITRQELLSSDDKTRRVSVQRQISYYLAREMAPLSYRQIGRLTGGKDHSTVIHGVRAIRAAWFERGHIYRDVNAIRLAVLSSVEERMAA